MIPRELWSVAQTRDTAVIDLLGETKFSRVIACAVRNAHV